MAFVPSFVRFEREAGLQEGLREGLKEGLQKGVDEGERRIVIRQARKRFADFSEGDERALRALPFSDLEAFSEALLDFPSLEALRLWIASRQAQA